MDQRNKKFRDEGFTRVSALLGIILAFALILMFSLLPKAGKPEAHVAGPDLPLQESLQDSLRTFVKNKLVEPTVPCANPAAFFQSHLFLRTYTGSVSQLKSDPPVGLSARSWDELFHGSMAASSFAGAALSRCPLTVLGTGGRFHFCLQVQRDVKAPPDSFLRTPLIFAEVSIQLVDQKSGKALSCAQYLDPMRTTAGATVDYLLFSIHDKGEELDVMKKRISFSIVR